MPDEQRERGLGGPSRTARRRCRSPYPPQSRPESSRAPAAAEPASLEVEPPSRAAERHHAKHAVDARRILAGHPIERPAFQLVPDMLSETHLPQVESLQARGAGRILHGLVSSPARTGEGSGQPRLEQDEIGAAGVDQQSNLLSTDGHPHRQERPRQLERRDPVLSWASLSRCWRCLASPDVMPAEYRHNHYVPVWYQKGFLPPGQVNQELFYLDFVPRVFTDPRGVKHPIKYGRR